jgi:hypothetical protein
MNETILLGRGKDLIDLPRAVWEEHLAQAPAHSQTRLNFMSPAHHQVRYFVVRELPTFGQPVPPEFIAQQLGLPPAQVQDILAELEQRLFFLVRNAQGAVVWAFPLTVEPTPHRLSFSSGEQLYAA